jgi:hypothetical protein
MGWEVDDIEATIRVLAARGVVFEEYDLPGLRTIDGIAEIEGNYPSKGTGGARRLVPRQRRNPLLHRQPVRGRNVVRRATAVRRRPALSNTAPSLSPRTRRAHRRSLLSPTDQEAVTLEAAAGVLAAVPEARWCCRCPSPSRSTGSISIGVAAVSVRPLA